ncbi:DUF29 domain-containing protein [Leptolyngbya sp. FACHB-17]|uniref:DUF29 domain-containing protein n=1 Tax=unclassified Leptolyngbya TaxID=2650499 RepID=UPI00168001CC|nr:DUF29 domain-containing protein [Leptolyngbya sp. FACHB-17]MBD2078910.1 DUF29 domain-containing protein [Leptolyngbya sp. FACHB-17]
MTQIQAQKTLYQQDLVAWLDDTVIKLKQRHFEEIDIDSLIEEIEGLAGRDRRELKNRLEVLLNHLLKRLYVYSPDDYRGWELTIREQRKQLKLLLEQSPSLRKYLIAAFPDAWKSALLDLREDYPKTQFPDEWQYSSEIDVLLHDKFWDSHD